MRSAGRRLRRPGLTVSVTPTIFRAEITGPKGRLATWGAPPVRSTRGNDTRSDIGSRAVQEKKVSESDSSLSRIKSPVVYRLQTRHRPTTIGPEVPCSPAPQGYAAA